MADQPAFASPAQARDYLVAALPQATAENPAYHTVSDGTVSRWLTKQVTFGGDAKGGVTVTMQESYSQTKDGKTTPGAHRAAFSLADVEVSEFTEPGDVTPEGAASRGVLLTCVTPGCIEAVWGDTPSKADKTDISIQNDAERARILAAFHYLKSNAP